MPVTVKVNGVANSLVHKGSNGISVATIPDVCKTPSPGGPVPIPYPNISQSISLDKGTTSVKADGGMMIANKGSEFSLSNGDNAGVAGGVKSSTFMKESTWILYSFDVKMDGKNACRLTDKKFQNHENTVDLAGALLTPTLVELDPEGRCPTCKAGSDHSRTQSYDDFFNPAERAELDAIASANPDLLGLLPPKGARYRFVKDASSARKAWKTKKAKNGLKGEFAHPIPLKFGGCPIHQTVLRKTDDPSDRARVDSVDDQINAVFQKVIDRA